MFADFIYELSPAAYANHILIDDMDGLNAKTNYISEFAAHGFKVVDYQDDLSFRLNNEEAILSGASKIVVLRTKESYFPYDMLKRMRHYSISLGVIFPKLSREYLIKANKQDLDLLSFVAADNYDDLTAYDKTRAFFEGKVYSRTNIQRFLEIKLDNLLGRLQNLTNYAEWFKAAEEKAFIDALSVQYDVNIDTSEINDMFQEYALRNFGGLSTKLSPESPVLVSHAMEYMHEHSDKFVVIVMDGMSEFDWNILSKAFTELQYERSAAFAMIPSTTSVSRQCLLSNKFPNQLIEPWNQSKEKIEFIDCAKKMGYSDSQIGYGRGYDTEFGSFVRCGAVIINDIDDLVHAQHQGRLGMYNDISVMEKERRLVDLTRRLLSSGFDVYITADHGNTLCTGIGKYVGAGVDVETKSHRMIVAKEFADKEKLMAKFDLVEYPKYFLPKEYDYYICNKSTSLDPKDTQVMTHGGMTLDEVVVPFIKIKAGDNNG